MQGFEMEPSSGGEAIRFLVHQNIIQFRITSHNMHAFIKLLFLLSSWSALLLCL
ncbi:unnamed protein product, partial [Brassica rapa]